MLKYFTFSNKFFFYKHYRTVFKNSSQKYLPNKVAVNSAFMVFLVKVIKNIFKIVLIKGFFFNMYIYIIRDFLVLQVIFQIFKCVS